MTLDPAGNIVVAGYGGSQSMVVARFNAAGQYNASAVCYAPHLIDYSARAVAVRPNGSIVLVGFARDRHPAFAVPAGPNVDVRPARRPDPPRHRATARPRAAPIRRPAASRSARSA